ncbi:metallophosphoesterase [Patescibacteria group bacterium]|nr:metallophosphoesterase [Patescibacteria group bacterium]MBU1922346.1 metallophosphoesterase [Patescibacteria group bacterium]
MAWENILFDAIIYFFLIAVGAGILELGDRVRKGRRFLFLPLIFVLMFSWLVVFYGSFIEPRMIVEKNYDLALAGGGEQEIKVVVLGDFHLGPYNDEYLIKNVVSRVNKVKPDLILLVGDYISYDTDAVAGFAPFFDLWMPPLGIYAVTGNHDYEGNIDEIISAFEVYNINFLRNEGVAVKMGEEEIFIAGVDDYWYGDMDVTNALIRALPGQKVIFLAHNPDVMNYVPETLRFDLMVSGHAHGGQIRLPFIGSVVQPPTDLPRNVARGLFEWGGRNLFITPGLGEVGPRARLFNPPEISVLNITF